MTGINHLSARHGDASDFVALKLRKEGEKGGGGGEEEGGNKEGGGRWRRRRRRGRGARCKSETYAPLFQPLTNSIVCWGDCGVVELLLGYTQVLSLFLMQVLLGTQF